LKIYTKTGDGGTTGLVGGSRVSKTDPRIVAIGEVDEANAFLGAASSALGDEDLLKVLAFAQAHLFEIGAELASPDGRNATVSLEDALTLEASMDQLSEELPPLTHFILPGGSPGSASLHLARSVVRRSERAVLDLQVSAQITVRTEVKVFLNRLSDWLFTAARTVNARAHVNDVIWQKD
jgi:cob(I)alamin adenosyltransferase